MNYSEELKKREHEEAVLQFEHFNNDDALALGMKVIELAKSRGAVSVEIVVNQNVIFHYTMTNSVPRHSMWIKRKMATVQNSLMSSLHVGQLMEANGWDLWKNWRLDEKDYGIIGGGFPITLKGTGVIGAIACSGLIPDDDHQLLVDAISEVIGITL